MVGVTDMRKRTVLVTTILLAVATVGVVPGPANAQGKTQKISKNLIKRAEDMVKDLEKARKQADKDRQEVRRDVPKEERQVAPEDLQGSRQGDQKDGGPGQRRPEACGEHAKRGR